MHRLELVQGDITKQQVDAIVNAANTSLLGGGGVDGAIHRAAGPSQFRSLPRNRASSARRLRRTGDAKISRQVVQACLLEYVIHTVGPVWQGGHKGEPQLLASCYQSCFRLATENDVETIAFPSISTGVYGYPVEQASRIALLETKHFFGRNSTLEKVVMVCFSARRIYRFTEKPTPKFLKLEPRRSRPRAP